MLVVLIVKDRKWMIEIEEWVKGVDKDIEEGKREGVKRRRSRGGRLRKKKVGRNRGSGENRGDGRKN